ncbi:MAG: zinc-ribbon domain-containing protein [Fimbriimonadales bacterium]|nr:zinc-ribbon domain-containing protein [Fimbriimonadales bacterium]
MRLRCRRCNAPIGLDDFVYIAYHAHTLGANRVEVHFQCGRCGHRGERMLRQADWDELMLSYLENDERSVEEWMATEQLGPITAEEIRAVRRALRSENLLESLRAWERARNEEQLE